MPFIRTGHNEVQRGLNEGHLMFDPLPSTGYVRLPAVLKVYPVSKSTWWAGIKTGKYPAGVKLSERVTAWKVDDIRALIQKGA